MYRNNSKLGGGGRSNQPEASFFKTSTDRINYKQILGFEPRREEEEEQEQAPRVP